MKRAGKRGRPRDRWYWDIEASDPERRWDGATLVIAKREDGETIKFNDRACLARWTDFIEKNPEIYYAHYGGGYDVPLLLNYWRPEKIIVTGSTILAAEGRGGLVMRDTYPYWLAGAGKIGEAIGVEKIDIDRAQIERLSQEELERYCERDVDVIRQAMIVCRAFLQTYGVNPDQVSTAGTAATSLMQKIEPLSYQILSDNKNTTQSICEMLDQTGNPGAMTNSYWLGRASPVYSYDIKSSYPSRYADREVPIGLRKATPGELARPQTFQGLARVSYTWPWPRHVPVAYDHLTGAGLGHIEAWICDDEIQILLELGITVKLHEGWCGVDYAPIGQDFARELFAAKEQRGPQSFFPKVFVNSWHGKSGMNPVRDNYEARYPKKYWKPGGPPKRVPDDGWLWHFFTLGCDKEGFAPWHSQPMISAIVLGRARAALWRINDCFQRAGWQIYYNDTDSLITDCPPDQAPMKLGNALGDLAFEGGPYDAIFLGAKAYILTHPASGAVAKCALKGVPHRSYKDAVWDVGDDGAELREARGVERLRGAGPFTRKGVGRDRRVEFFERALAGSARAHKEGLATFKMGLRDVEWKRRGLTREVRPTITNVAIDANGWRLLTADEILSDD